MTSIELPDQRFVVNRSPSGERIAHLLTFKGDPAAGVLMRGRVFRYELVGPEGGVDPAPARLDTLEIEGVRTSRGAAWEIPLELLASRRIGTLIVRLSPGPLPFEIAPVLDGVSPTAAAPGSAVRLVGSLFGAAPGEVQVGGVSASVESWGDREIRVRVPSLPPGTYPVVVRAQGSSAPRSLEVTGGATPPGGQVTLGPAAVDATRVQRGIDQRQRLLPPSPPYLYATDTVSGSIAAVWMDVTGRLLGTEDLRARYDEFYQAALGYRGMAILALARADRSLREGAVDRAVRYVADADRYLKLFHLSVDGAGVAYEGNTAAAADLAKGIYQASRASAKYGAAVVLGPWASRTVDGVFLITDFVVDSSALGSDEATQRAVRTLLTRLMFDEVRISSLGGKTLSEFLSGKTTQAIGSSRFYPILDEILGSPEFERALMTVLAKSAAYDVKQVAKTLTEALSAELAHALAGS